MLRRKRPELRNSVPTQWVATPVAPFTVQRVPGAYLPNLMIREEHPRLADAVRRAWDLIWPYQQDMIVQVVDARDSLVLARDGRDIALSMFGVDGVWYGTQATFDALAEVVDDTALVEFLRQKAHTATEKLCPSR